MTPVDPVLYNSRQWEWKGKVSFAFWYDIQSIKVTSQLSKWRVSVQNDTKDAKAKERQGRGNV